LGWALGNETYSTLKYFYQKPYLNSVRRAYIDLIEKLTQKIHELDPQRPVFAILPHTNILQGAVTDFHKYAPSIDIMGINSHDKDDLKSVQKIMGDLDFNRPYIISEFSSGGYWNEEILEMEKGMVLEKTDHEKGNQYFWNWIKYVEFKKGYNVGGIAYSWRDKPEGTATWFGITDIKGRLKPAYYRLRKVWQKTYSSIPMPWVIIQGPMEISSDKTYEFNALEEYEGNFTYEWYLQSEKRMEYLGKLEAIGEGRKVRVTIPPIGNSELRLYVYVSDKHGNVVSASLPLKMKK
jgi:cellulose synthase (UDP-forming)